MAFVGVDSLDGLGDFRHVVDEQAPASGVEA
jgi:hypothetical protein